MYTILNNNLQVKGKLTLDNGQGSTAFFGDAITQQIATDNSTDPNNLTTQAFNETDKQGNSKSWGHSLTLSCENTAIGSSITTADSILYLDNVSNKYYLMKIIDISGDRNSGFRTINAVNTAVYELGKKLFNTEKTYTRASLADVVKEVYKDVPFSLRIEDDLETVIDYTISAGTSAQAIFQDLQTKYDVDIDSWVELDNSGNLSERVLYFGHLGTDNGELIRYGGAKGFENITAQEVSDTIYTKLWVNGQTDDKNPNNGHIGSVNNGLEYIIDDDANAREYPIGANQQQPAYLEGIITNNLLSEPQALLDWAKLQMPIFNHARFNYTVTPLHDQVVGIGDTVAVQDFHMQPMILVTSKVIQKVTSFASPETNTFVLGEFSNIFTEQLNKNSNVITLIKKDVTVVQEAADNARVAADEAHKQAVIAQSKAIKAQTSADGKATAFTVSSLDNLPKVANEGDIAWVNNADGTYGYTYINGKWVEDINPHLEQQITDGVNTSIQTAKQNTDKAVSDNNKLIDQTINDVSIQQANNEIDKRKFEVKAQAMADKSLSDAKADNQTVATQTLASANSNLATAKSQIESAYKSADGVISKKVDDTATTIGNTITQNKKISDNGISTAQSTAQQAVDGLKAKVSQSEYDGKTKDLTTKVGTAQLTADNATTTIGNYQKSNDNRVKTTETAIDQNANDIQLRATKQDLNNATGNLNTAIGKVDVRAGQVELSVSELSNTVNSMGQINQLMNTEFNPDLSNWTFNSTNSNDPYRSYVDKNAGATTVGFNTLNASDNSFARLVQLIPVDTFAGSASISISWQSYATDFAFYNNLWIRFLDSSGAVTSSTSRQWTNLNSGVLWERQKWENISVPDGTTTVSVSFEAREGTRAYLVRPMLVFSDTIGSYTAGNYNNNDKIALQQLTIDGFNQTVSDTTGKLNNVTSRVQTAEGTLSTATDNISGLTSKTNQMAGQFNQEITDRKTGDSNTLNSAKGYTVSQIQGYDSGLQTQLTQTNDAFIAIISSTNLVVDSSLVDSAMASSIVNWLPSGASNFYYSPGASYKGVQSIGYNQTNDTGTYSFLDSQSWNQNSFSGSTLNVSIDVRAANIGGTSTDYLIVILMEQDNNGNQTQRTEVTGSIRNTNNNWVNYRKKITINPNSKKFFIRYQMRGNGNVYIARPYVGVQELIDGGYTAGTNNNNQTILSLFKDNWSIGIADNLGTITNGIVGTPSNLSLISKNVTIDSPQTQINGKAWIKSADIANGAIGAAQIGDASITSAKIANLDASKISGGTISGVDFLVNKSITIASGGNIQSDVVNMGKTSFNVNATNIATERYSTQGYLVRGNGSFLIDSQLGNIGSWGTIGVAMPGKTDNYKNGYFHSEYGINNMLLQAYNYDNGEDDETMNLSSSALDYYTMKKNTKELTRSTNIKSGSVFVSDSVTSNGTVASKNIMLNDAHGIVMMDNVDLYLLGANGNPVGMHGKSWSNTSLRSMKENFSNVEPEYALDEVLKTDIKSYNFKGDKITDNYVSPIIDDTEGEFYIPKDFLDSTGRGVKTYSIDGYLIQAIKALQEQITELKQG
ncbi:hypothetical protein FE414_07085 [Leuconostoc carnosum]|uniref:hypothetical protein n=1 Tax=Leuconostoc carnosum TaxID=1252 RepID=UPI001238724B|nr:hypothetical protein [Leuconostoc carnosum]KAA8369793.1 hypothetical protein FE414_07085 [Leuconostoc carnosum]